MPDAVVIVVGGGASGLSAAAALTRRRIEVVVLEQDATVGGTWARRYDRLRLHSVRAFSGLAHFSIPRRFPAYLSRNDVVAYLDEYARHFNLRVITGTTVDRIRPRRDPQPTHASAQIASGRAARRSRFIRSSPAQGARSDR